MNNLETDYIIYFSGIVKSYELINRYMNCNNKGIMLIPNLNNVGDIFNTNALTKAFDFGQNI